mgnify:CR=1 FL=1
MLRDQLFKTTTRALEHLLHRVVLVPLEEREGGGRALGRLERLGAAAEVAPDLSAMDPLQVELRAATGEKCAGWLGARGWSDICALSDMLEECSPQGKSSEVNLKSLIASFGQSTGEWKEVFDAEDPDFTPFPDGWDKDKSKEQGYRELREEKAISRKR